MNIKVDTSKYKLYTRRFILRQWLEDDLEDLYEYASTPGLGEQAGWAHHKNKSKSENLLGHYLRDKNNFALVYQDNDKVIGSIGINRYNERRNPEMDSYKGRELGYVLSKEYWNQGLMTEALQAVIRWLFEVYEVDFILCANFKDNLRSARVQEKCGFIFYQEIQGLDADKEEKISDLNILNKERYEKIYK